MLAQLLGSADHKRMNENPADAWTLAELRREFARYSERVNASDLAPSSKLTYLQHATASCDGSMERLRYDPVGGLCRRQADRQKGPLNKTRHDPTARTARGSSRGTPSSASMALGGPGDEDGRMTNDEGTSEPDPQTYAESEGLVRVNDG